jgi:regulator of sigma E protease
VSIGIAILGLAALIFMHEAGHFVAARAVGMRPRKFYLGFPPALVKTTRGGVEYGIGSIPLGGYVKIPGMHRPAPGDLTNSLPPEKRERLAAGLAALDGALSRGDEAGARREAAELAPHLAGTRMFDELQDALSPEAYWRQKAWRRIVVIAAGPVVNLLAAVLLFVGVFATSSETATSTVGQVVAGHPAAAAGVQVGDTVVAVGGKVVEPSTLSTSINATHGRPFVLTVEREGKRVRLGPMRARLDGGSYRIGIGLNGKLGPGEPLPAAVGDSMRLTWQVIDAQARGLGGLFFGRNTHDVSSSVGIVRDTAKAYKISLGDYFFFLGLISLALAFLNLLPVLPLDGGHIVMSILERLRGGTFSQLAYLRYSAVGVTLFMFLLYLGLRNDLNLFS